MNVAFYLPAVLIICISFYAVSFLGLSLLWYAVPITFAGIAITLWLHRKDFPKEVSQISIPFFAILGVYVLVAAYLKPIEKYRPYKEIGKVINLDNSIIDTEPILIQNTLIHNIPFYAERKAIRDMTSEEINSKEGKTLALVRAESIGELSGFKTLWTGMIYDFPSESQFAKFVMACINAENGDFSKFTEYHLVFKEE